MSLSVVAIQPPSAIFREEQRFGWWTYALLALLMATSWALFQGRGPVGPPFVARHGQAIMIGVASTMVVAVAILFGVLRMTTLVTPSEVRVWFGFVPTYRRSISTVNVVRVEVVQYRPVRDYGGWGIRPGPDNERVYNARGNLGVRLHMVDGSKILIGSQRPEELALAVEGSLLRGH